MILKFLPKILFVSLTVSLLCTDPLTSMALDSTSQNNIVSGSTVRRDILGLYDDSKNSDPFFSYINQQAAMPLNHLGLRVHFASSYGPYPSDQEMQNMRGVLAWFTSKNHVKDNATYCRWLSHQIDQGINVVLLGDMGLKVDGPKGIEKQIPNECQNVFLKLGAKFQGDFSDNPFFFEIVSKDSTMTEYERKLDFTEPLTYDLVESSDPKNKVYLKIKRTDMGDSTSDLVFTSPHGGYVHNSYVLYRKKVLDKQQWRINPFRFFDEAFATTGIPRPDTATLNGKRIFYSHIDGDGIVNVSDIDRKSFSGEIIFNEIIKKYPSLPITASLITAYFDLPEFKSSRIEKMYEDILTAPNVEPASHGYSHPLVWNTGEIAIPVSKYKFSAEKEITGSTEMIQEKLVKFHSEKTAHLFLWTGDCRPTANQTRLVNATGILDINGGDSRFDHVFDSVSFVSPLGILRNGELQVYASNSNENTYTNNWQGPYYGYRLLKETFQNTETPQRLKPINVYYHYYSGEKIAALAALKEMYDFALTQDIIAIKTSEYAKMVEDFFTLQIAKTAQGFRITNQGNLRTLRYDSETRQVDLIKSTGVIGFNHYQGNLYVFLDESKSHEIILTNTKPHTPYVISASFQISDWKSDSSEMKFTKQGWHKSHLKLGGLSPGARYQIKTSDENLEMQTDANGIAEVIFKHSEGNAKPVSVSITAGAK